MKNFKLMPLTIAVAASLTSISAIAADANIEALEKRIQELESKVVEIDYVNDQQQAVLTPDTEVPLGVVFSGYARYGALYQAEDAARVVVEGSYNGSSAIGRLGNEGNGGEFQFAKVFQNDNGAIWDVVVMFAHWSDEVELKKAYAGATNVFESQPNLYVWAGRDFHQRPQQGLNDYQWQSHDGQGGGFNNLELGSVKLDMGVVSQVKGCSSVIENVKDSNGNIKTDKDGKIVQQPSCTGSADVGDNGNYALTSKLHGIDLGFAGLDLYANYGFDSKAIDSNKQLSAYQVGAIISRPHDAGANRLVLRYSNNADNSVYNKTDNLKTTYASFEGDTELGVNAKVAYLLSYHNRDVANAQDSMDNRTNYGAIVRPMYNWSDQHSTWVELGYQQVDYKNHNDSNTGWKATLSQNITFAASSSPMLRFYTTVGEADNKVSRTAVKNDTVSFGAMFEASW